MKVWLCQETPKVEWKAIYVYTVIYVMIYNDIMFVITNHGMFLLHCPGYILEINILKVLYGCSLSHAQVSKVCCFLPFGASFPQILKMFFFEVKNKQPPTTGQNQ